MKRILHVPFKPIKRQFIAKYCTTIDNMPASYKKRVITPEIKLNETETKIRNLLVRFCNQYNAKQQIPDKDIVLRVTGGWVRDKLLGDESNDLDIAINHLSGEVFTRELMQFIKENENDKELISHSVHKIELNPEKSKHLETCTTKLYGLDIDFVNLRNEEYTDESRIPKIRYGTPVEDAYRRDATLNALFYNLTTEKVEDFTGQGLTDLSNGILRTPLPPMKTFLDDPLRCLRLIRFASRFGFDVAEELIQLMKDESIKLALMRKISRERVGVEIHKILQGPIPEYGLELIHETGLYDAIFNFGDNYELIEELNKDKKFAIDEINASCNKDLGNFNDSLKEAIELINNSSCKDSFNSFINDKLNKKMLYLSLILKNWQGFKVKTSTKKLKNENFVTELIIKEGLKFSTKESDIITIITNNSDEYYEHLQMALDPTRYKRSTLGILIRKYGEKWVLCMWFNLIKKLFIETNNNNNKNNSILEFQKFQNLINDENLSTIWTLKPIIDGKSLLKELNLKPGPWMKPVNDQILIWQLDHPEKDRDDCIQYVKTILPNYV